MMTNVFPIDFQWPTFGPYLFCVHHFDRFPKGNAHLGLDAKEFVGRNMGQDFQEKDGFRLYHGKEIPGFPVHPHRGFETITIVRKGLVDHADSLGAAGRYGEGDVQWMTAGSGVQHSEMFPLLHKDKENTLELFQIWLNLPMKSKMVAPHFLMFWANDIPQIDLPKVSLSLIAGKWNATTSLIAPPDSWASDPENEVFIALVKMEKEGELEIPASKNSTVRTLYFFEGSSVVVNGEEIPAKHGVTFDGKEVLSLKSKDAPLEFLVLQAKDIKEPVVQHGPFVMNSQEDIRRTIQDYQKTQFGGWPWPRADMIHGENPERFAKYPDGKIIKPKV
jgi:redox-sensitive bicupin YhaK (pirin superfamily)